jgi:hypothetical protein
MKNQKSRQCQNVLKRVLTQLEKMLPDSNDAHPHSDLAFKRGFDCGYDSGLKQAIEIIKYKIKENDEETARKNRLAEQGGAA